MGRPRADLQAIFEDIPGVAKVYFQPPNGVHMVYPCIVYERDAVGTQHADNIPYRSTKRYMVTIVDKNPDSVIPDKVAALPTASFNRFFTADNLNHDVYTIYF